MTNREFLRETAEILAFRQMNKFLKICFRGKKYPSFVTKLMKYVSTLKVEKEPQLLEENCKNCVKLLLLFLFFIFIFIM